MATSATGWRAYVIVWTGQFVSLVGSNMTSFGLDVWVFRKSGSVTLLGLVLALSILPYAAVSPFAGSLVDRWGPRRALVVANIGNLLITAVMAVLLLTGTFHVWHVYVVGVTVALLAAMAIPAFGAMAPILVPKEHLGRANALRMFALAVSQTAAPLTGGFVLLTSGLAGVVVIDCISFAVATLALAFVRIPPIRPAESTTAEKRSLLAEFGDAWRFVSARRGLLALLFFLAAVNFGAGFIDVSLAPTILSFASSAALGTVIAVGGVGMILTTTAMSAWGGPRHRVRAMLWLTLVLGAATVIGASRPNVALMATAAFFFLGAIAVILSINQTVWQVKVPAAMMGRVLALENIALLLPQLLAYVAAGVAADRVFQPLVGRHEVHSETVATLVGHGPGRGIALMLMIMGVLITATVGIAALSPRLRHVEDEVPDAMPDAATDPDETTPLLTHS